MLFGPGTVEEAHYPDERIHWPSVVEGTGLIAAVARSYLGGPAKL